MPSPSSLRFLLLAGAASLANRANASDRPRTPGRDSPQEDPVRFDAVIVGAGWSGLMATKTLLLAGVSSVLVLEANDYIGGRSKSINSDGSINSPGHVGNVTNMPFDLGTEWQYVDGSEMEDYLKDEGFFAEVDLDELEVPDTEPMASAQFYKQSIDEIGNVITTVIEDEEEADRRERVWGGFMDFRRTLLDEIDDQDYHSAAENYKTNYLTDEEDIQYLNAFLDYGKTDHTGRLNEISFATANTWGHSVGTPVHYASVPGAGYGNLAAKFAAPFSARIKLSAKVTKIDYADDDDVIVSFTENEVTMTVAAKTVLVTASLGVLKAGSISFNPSLPDWKQETINGMGFGLQNKCIMQWEDRDAMVWPEKQMGFQLATPSSDTSGKWTTFFNPSQFKGAPVLEGQIGADDAREMEKQADKEVLADVMKNLRAMFPTITCPDRVTITRWGQEGNILGGYSFKVVNRDFDADSFNLKWPLENKIWFAGEATAGDWYGTAVGAWETGKEAGQRMAEEIFRLGIGSAEPPSSFWGTATAATTELPAKADQVVESDVTAPDAPANVNSCPGE